jgi:hypothetical protein
VLFVLAQRSIGVGEEEIGEKFGTEADTDDIDTWLIAGIVASAAVGVGMFYYSKRRKQYVKKPLEKAARFLLARGQELPMEHREVTPVDNPAGVELQKHIAQSVLIWV